MEDNQKNPKSDNTKKNLESDNIQINPASDKDIYDEIGNVFENLENMDASVDSESRTRTGFRRGRTWRKKSRRFDNIDDIDLMKAFVDAPFQYQEAFLSLRTNINFLAANKALKRIIITSSLPSEGKTSIAVNLSLALSAVNNKVMLIDADFRKPLIHKYLKIPEGSKTGATSILRSKDGSSENCVFHNIDRKGLSVMPCGVIPPNPTELLGSPQMEMMLKQLDDLYDYVIIDTPPVSVVTDAAVLSQYADGVLFVVRQKEVTFEQARLARKNLDAVNANILGVVINDFNMKHIDRTNGHYYSYYYQYGGKKS